MVKILLIDDSDVDALVLKNILSEPHNESFELEHVSSLETGFASLKKNKFDVILLDLFLPDSSGLATVTQMWQQAPKIPIVVLTGLKDESAGIQAIQEGAQDYLVKGQHDLKLVTRVIRYAIERKKLMTDLQEAMANIKTLKGMLPICFRCKKIRNDQGFWDKFEIYIRNHSEISFSHGLCPDCFKKELSNTQKSDH